MERTEKQFKTLGDVLRHHAETTAHLPALTFEGRTTDYQSLEFRSNAVANALLAMGCQPGDRVAYLGKNSDLAIELTLGAAKAGVVLVPVIWRLAADEIEFILDDCGANLLFVGAGLSGLAEQIMLGRMQNCTIIGMGFGDEGAAHLGWLDFDSWRDAQPTREPAVEVETDDVLIQIYTSGTTGRPKGAMLTHGNLTRYRPIIEAANLPWMNPEPGEAAMLAMPFAHIAGVGTALLAIYSGQHVIILQEFEPSAVLDAIERHKLRRLFLVPAALQILLAHPKAATTDFSSLRYFSYGASPIPIALLKQGLAALGCGFVQVYGMTETWGGVVALAPEDHTPEGNRIMASAGRALPGVELRVLDEHGMILPANMVGEIAIRSPSNMAGYWNRSDETARTIDAEGWLRTGDAGLLDDNGYLFIQDRIKDMIISGGENIYPAEVESAIFGHADVVDVAVFGVPDEKWGEAVKAIVVLRPGCELNEQGILDYAATKIARYKIPKSIGVIDILPRNPSGKILRRALREPFWTDHERRVS